MSHLSVIGFDDIPWAQIVTPALTTISQPVSEMAIAAFGLLKDRIADPRRAVRHLTIGVRLIKRDSTSLLASDAR